MLLVSVVIPTYNSANTIGQAIDSALAQTYPQVEVVVVDDGSLDSTVDLLKSYGNRIRWRSGANYGACAARNTGVSLASGQIIQFLDADDLLHTHKLERQVPVLLAGGVRQLVFCDAEILEESGRRSLLARTDSTTDPVVFALGATLQTSAPIHWKGNLEAVGGFRTELPCAQERDLHLRLAAKGVQFVRIPEVLYTIRRQPGSLSASYLKVLDQHAGIVWPVFHDLKARGELTDLRARACAGFLARAAREYLRKGRPDDAQRYFRQAQEMHPAGGLDVAYGRQGRILMRILGPYWFEALSRWSRGRGK